jgi:RNA polymerase sigma factor, sigma-70 family/RNA polymerase sigma-70 factor, Bacteroides expansion family 1
MEDQERELLLISKGNELAFNSFMNRHSKSMYYHAFGILSNNEMSEEVVSDVFLEVWKSRKTLIEIENITSWLNTVVYRKSISYLRKEMKRNKDMSFDDLENFSFPIMESPMDDLISNEEMEGLNTAIESLPPKCKHVFFLAKIEKIPYAEIANMLQISLATVNYHISFAMNVLKKKLVQG